MRCRSCQAEIADKAIVCYRCGTPTADLPAVPRTAPPPARRPWWLLVLALVLAALAVWFVPELPEESPLRWAIWAGVLVVLVGAALRLVRRRR
jgi:protein-S-isoprenylcysteine O-methyltransferase Ste14